jgi:hypothetical protein
MPSAPPPPRRLANHYLSAAAGAMNVIAPAHRQERPDVDSVTMPWTSEVEARAWLDAERANLLAFARAAAAAGNDDDVVRIAAQHGAVLRRRGVPHGSG